MHRTHVRILSNSMEQRWLWRCWNVTVALFAVRNFITLCWSLHRTIWIQSTVSPRCFLKIPFNIIPASTTRSSSFPTEHQTVNLCSISVWSVILVALQRLVKPNTEAVCSPPPPAPARAPKTRIVTSVRCRWGRAICVPTKLAVLWVPERILPQEYNGQGVKLTTHLHLLPSVIMLS